MDGPPIMKNELMVYVSRGVKLPAFLDFLDFFSISQWFGKMPPQVRLKLA